MMGNVIRAGDLYEDEKKSKDSSSPARRGSLPVPHRGAGVISILSLSKDQFHPKDKYFTQRLYDPKTNLLNKPDKLNRPEKPNRPKRPEKPDRRN